MVEDVGRRRDVSGRVKAAEAKGEGEEVGGGNERRK